MISSSEQDEKSISRRNFLTKAAAATAIAGAGIVGAGTILGVPRTVSATTSSPVEQPDYIIYIDSSGNYDLRNGITGNIDYITSDAASALQTAINSLPSTGGLIALRQGTYTLKSTVNLTNPNTTIAGIGVGTVLTQPNGYSLPNLIHVSANASMVRDMCFDGNGSQQTGVVGAGLLHYDLGSDLSRGHNLLFRNAYDNGIFINSAVGKPPSQQGHPLDLSFSQITGTGNGLPTKGGSTFDNGSGTRVTLNNYVSDGDGTGLVLTDIYGGAETFASAVAISGSHQDGIYNGAEGILSDFVSKYSGRYGLFLDGGVWASVMNFDLNNNSAADLNVTGSLTPQNPFLVSFGRLRSSTRYTSSVNNTNVVHMFNVYGYP
jgi:hypothetical protein